MIKPLLLVIDDEPEMAEYVGIIGESVGFEIFVTSNAREFQKTCLLRSPSAIVMDIVMPDLDGNELLRWISEEKILTPIIIMSGYDQYTPITKNLAEKLGCTIAGTISKPSKFDELEHKLQKIMNTQS